MITDMKIIDNLSLKFAGYLRDRFYLYTNLIIYQEIIVELMFQPDTMKDQGNVLLSFKVHMILLEKHFESVLIKFFLETTAHFAMKLHSKAKYLATLFGIK